ncbi:DNA-binding pseudobarrel domain containing protein [Parasponia andersonii]|uniref:DNA-binding pseudobarrel domain containing protein n=1 Tax=Parasponia andersonii TaxID=3476 RepID=A0A2P5BQR8_PARAD|nr:DNA-binding pseudobarrel domain containing protein [Parasponia andersonii]
MKICATGKLRKSKGSRGTYKSYKNSRAFEKAGSFSSSNPFFIKIVRGDHRACYSMQRLSNNFIKGLLERKTQIVKLRVGMQYWHMKLLNYDSRSFFSEGLSTFLNENALGPGDEMFQQFAEVGYVLRTTKYVSPTWALGPNVSGLSSRVRATIGRQVRRKPLALRYPYNTTRAIWEVLES